MDTSMSPRRRSQLLSTLVVVGIVVVGLIWVNHAERNRQSGDQGPVQNSSSGPPTDPVSGLAYIQPDQLPQQARDTIQLIRDGGPYPYPANDDQTYFNNNGILPAEDKGYYREFTVPTPGANTRGARRIIAGDGGELYYTEDHYSSFFRIQENL